MRSEKEIKTLIKALEERHKVDMDTKLYPFAAEERAWIRALEWVLEEE